MNSEQVVTIRSASENDVERVMDFLFKSFYPYEPITIGSKSGRPTQGEIDFTVACLSEKMSYIAYVSNGSDEQIVGVILCGVARPTDAQYMLDLSEEFRTADEEWSKMLKFYAWIDIANDHFRRLNIDQGYHCHALAVSENYRGRNIAKNMVVKSIENARKMKFKLYTLDCSSYFTIRIAQSLGMTTNNMTPFNKIVDENGEQLFDPPQPHTTFATYELPL